MSRLKSNPAAKAKTARPARAAARPAARGGVYVQQPKSDVWVALLGCSLGAMVLGCLFLVLKLNAYGFELAAR
jgi:hypothetical protein